MLMDALETMLAVGSSSSASEIRLLNNMGAECRVDFVSLPQRLHLKLACNGQVDSSQATPKQMCDTADILWRNASRDIICTSHV